MKIKAVFFDMFNTLADPHVYLEYTESQVIGMDRSEWSSYVWREDIARDRGIGIIKTEDELMDRICEILPFSLSVEQKEAVKAALRERQRKCMTEIREDIVRTVKALKAKGFLWGVISTADVTDSPAWKESPLYP
ncbi:MAG: HAD family hydrolase [Firmicutes bacterium]|nr:HAD family hydrolase [Bacillota bacterium]